MSFSSKKPGPQVPDSYSRQLDEQVARQEMPYGYTGNPPAADTGDYDQRSYETKNQYKPGKNGRAV